MSARFLARTAKHGWVAVEPAPRWGGFHTVPGKYSIETAAILQRAELPDCSGVVDTKPSHQGTPEFTLRLRVLSVFPTAYCRHHEKTYFILSWVRGGSELTERILGRSKDTSAAAWLDALNRIEAK